MVDCRIYALESECEKSFAYWMGGRWDDKKCFVKINSLPYSPHLPSEISRNTYMDHPVIKTCSIKSVPCGRNLMDADSRIFPLTSQIFNHVFIMPYLLLRILSDLKYRLIIDISSNEKKQKQVNITKVRRVYCLVSVCVCESCLLYCFF